RPAGVRQSRLDGRYWVLSSVIGVSRGAGGGPAPVSGEVVTASFRWCPRGGGGTGSAPAGFGRRRRAAAGARGRPRGGRGAGRRGAAPPAAGPGRPLTPSRRGRRSAPRS